MRRASRRARGRGDRGGLPGRTLALALAWLAAAATLLALAHARLDEMKTPAPGPLRPAPEEPRRPGGPARVVTLHVLDVENVPSAFAPAGDGRARLDAALAALERRNPGLRFRVVAIRRTAHGRDPAYRPWIHARRSTESPFGGAWLYAGTLPQGDPAPHLLDPARMSGPLLVDGAPANGGAAYADAWNHAQRPLEPRSGPPETLHDLLDAMARGDPGARGLLVVDLSGGRLPAPPLRNWSDPAKSPLRLPGLRAVAHPEALRTPPGAPLRLRVHAWLDSPSPDGADILVRLDGDYSRPGDLRVVAVDGGVDRDGDGRPEAYREVFPAPADGAMSWIADVERGRTVLRFRGTPFRCPPLADESAEPDRIAGGLADGRVLPDGTPTADRRATGREHRAAPGPGLATPGDGPKNTARWIVEVSPAALARESRSGVFAFETALGGPDAFVQPNVSRSVVWRTDDPRGVPLSERAALLGDPALSPYGDAPAAPAGSREAWLAMLREALLASGSVWLALPGEDAAAPSFGGDLFAPRGSPGVPVCRNVLDGGPGARRLGARGDGAASDWTVAESGDGGWIALPALGALAPDSQWGRWLRLGNLPAGAKPRAGGAFVRRRASEGVSAGAPGLASPAAGLLRAVEPAVERALPTSEGRALLERFGLDAAGHFPVKLAFAADARRVASGVSTACLIAEGAGGAPVLVVERMEEGRGKDRRRAAVVQLGATGDAALELAVAAALSVMGDR